MSNSDPTDDEQRTSVSRRRFVAASGATGVAATLAGCADLVGGGDGNGEDGGSTGGDGGTTVRFGFDPTATQQNGDAIKTALHELGGLSEDITVELVPGDSETGARRQNYTRLLSSGESDPDMFLMDNGWVNVFIQAGLIQNLEDGLSDDVVSTVSEEYFEGFTATARDPESDELYGVPVFPDFPTMQYRKDLVEQAGYSPDENNWATEPMTWQEWSQITADTLDNSDVDYGWTTQWDIYVGTACCDFNEVMSSWGGAYFGGRENLFGPVGDRPVTVNKEPVIQSLNMMRHFVHGEEFETSYKGVNINDMAGEIAPTQILGWTEESSRAPFAEGNAVMHRNWPYSLALTGRNPDETDDPALGENLGAMPIPYAVPESDAEEPGAGGTTAALGGWHTTVNPNSDKLDAVYQVIEAMTSTDFQLELLNLQGWLPPRPSLFESEEAQSLDVIGRFMDTLQVAGQNTMARPVTSVWSEQESAIAEQANRAVDQATSSSEAMESLQSTLEELEQQG
ncbi:sugar ABC transporter substrate-binding protein [Halobacteriales archaeon QS_4_62_28]|nr:MAG: sugar ABC transporter substrate-binding protein [Halobacteriales archaeon QS_4_62_28]